MLTLIPSPTSFTLPQSELWRARPHTDSSESDQYYLRSDRYCFKPRAQMREPIPINSTFVTSCRYSECIFIDIISYTMECCYILMEYHCSSFDINGCGCTPSMPKFESLRKGQNAHSREHKGRRFNSWRPKKPRR